MNQKDINQLGILLQELLAYPKESEWLEFKHNNEDPKMIGERISALANSACLLDKPYGYLVWGIKDETHQVVGTDFCPTTARHNQQELESWLLQKIEPKIDFAFFEFEYQTKKMVILQISSAVQKPVRFDGTEFIRIGSYTKKLREFSEKERALWRILEKTPFERQIAMRDVTGDKVLKLLDFSKYFDLTNQPLPENQAGILDRLCADKLIFESSGLWHISNLGAILFAKNLADFDHLAKKAVRIIRYQGNDKFATIQEMGSRAGYAVDFEMIMHSIKALLPSYEEIGLTFRQNMNAYPDIALRELVANALIHQDFSQSGTSPMIEIFLHRLEIINAGSPLIEVNRFMDKPPCSRNEHLASLMRRMNICEERGSGIDKVMWQIEFNQMPAPLFENLDNYTKVVLFTYRPFGDMSKEDRLRACYWHCVFKYIKHEQMSNASLRERFGNAVSPPMISKIIKEATEKNLIRLFDETAGTRAMKYIPFWA